MVNGGSILKKGKIIIVFLSSFIIYFVFIRDEFPIVEALPPVMEEQYDIVFDEKMNKVSLQKDGLPQSIVISIDKDKTLYIANSVGDNITKFTVSKEKDEIYIRKNVINYQTGDNDKFQLIEVPYSKYKDIVSENKVNVFIDYGLGYESREYNLTNSEYKMLEYVEPTK
jgi:hypothetical protein